MKFLKEKCRNQQKKKRTNNEQQTSRDFKFSSNSCRPADLREARLMELPDLVGRKFMASLNFALAENSL
jgi:hypothetical protein